MLTNFRAISLSYKSANLQIREEIALTDDQSKQFLFTSKDVLGLQELLVLSTCNRTEVYYSANEDLTIEIVKLLCYVKGLQNAEKFIPYFKVINNQDEAVNHLFRVSIGLESQVVGDLQITSQVKQAYQWSADEQLAGPFLHRLLHTTFYTNKKVVQETNFRDGAASVSYATVELIENLCEDKVNPKVLILGLGQIGKDLAENLKGTTFSEIHLANRTTSKAKELAEAYSHQYLPYDEVLSSINKFDVIVSAIQAETPFFNLSNFPEKGFLTYKYMIDLAVPRSIDPKLEQLPGVVVYNIDQIQNKANAALELRIKSIPSVEKLIEDSISEFNNWSQETIMSPTINKLKNALEQIRIDELTRYAKQLNEHESKMVDLITKNIMQKVIKLPVLQLKAACKRGEAESLIELLSDLFDLEKDKVSQ